MLYGIHSFDVVVSEIICFRFLLSFSSDRVDEDGKEPLLLQIFQGANSGGNEMPNIALSIHLYKVGFTFYLSRFYIGLSSYYNVYTYLVLILILMGFLSDAHHKLWFLILKITCTDNLGFFFVPL